MLLRSSRRALLMFYMQETESRDEYISYRKKATKAHLFGLKKELRD